MKGRWPTNVILDDHAAAMLDAQSGERGGNSGGAFHHKRRALNAANDGSLARVNEGFGYADTGGASRFNHRANSHAEVVELLMRLIAPPGGVVLYLKGSA